MLGEKSCDEFQIYQMVVEPKYQGQGLGRQILQALIEAATAQGASLVTLNARVTKMLFYQKSGFEPVGEVFASSSTGIAHIQIRVQFFTNSSNYLPSLIVKRDL